MKLSARATAIAAVSLILFVLPAGAAPPLQDVIVVLEGSTGDVEGVAGDLARAHGGRVGFVYENALKGFTMRLPAGAVAALANNPRVVYVEPDFEVDALQVGGQPVPTGVDRVEADLNPPSSPLDVDIAILDTGVYIGTNPDGTLRSHLDLNLRYVTDCSGAIFYPLFGGCTAAGNTQDEHGHGSHVAGIAAALDNGFGSVGTAPGATLWSVKVLDASGSGTGGTILAGIDTVAAHADQIEVANMSLGFEGSSQAIDDAIAAATDRGVVFVVAAGNSSIDASQFSPASSPDVITVSALADFDGKPGGLGDPTCRVDEDDTLANFSNFGAAVEIAAPGVCIFSTHLNDGYTTFSGTSMASPAVAGAVARYIAENGLDPQTRADVEAIKAAVIGAAMPQGSACGFTGDVDSSPEPLLFLNGPAYGGDGTCEADGQGNIPPTAAFDYVCDGLSCAFTDHSTDPDGTIESWLWEFGDGSAAAEAAPEHTFSATGDYAVSLTVTDDEGDTDTATTTVSVSIPGANQPPSASFTWWCDNLNCNFTDASSDADGDQLTHSWDFDDGATSAAANPTHSYASAGSYVVTLTVSDGTELDTATQQLTVTEPASTLMTAVVAPILVDGRDASITIGVIDGDGNGIAGATVAGTWSYEDQRGRIKTASVTGTAGATGDVAFTKRFPPSNTVVSFCVTSVAASGYTYVPPPLQCGFPLD